MMVERQQVALVGCGQWGQHLARNLLRLGALRTACDPNPAALEEVRRLDRHVAVTADLEPVLNDPTITACVIAAPAALHHAVAVRCLEAGKDLLVEKPLALTAREGDALVRLARERGRILMVGHLLEYHPAIERLRELVRTGSLGQIRYVYSNRLNLGRIRTEENALWSFAPHDVHVLLRLLGEFPVEVMCHGGSYLNHQVADVTMSLLRFASGVRSHIFVSWLHPYKEHKLVVVGSQKMAVFDALSEHQLVLYPHRVDWIERVPVAVRADAEIVPLAAEEPLARECRHFLECLKTREVPRTDGASGLEVLRVLEACQQSLEHGGSRVPLASPERGADEAVGSGSASKPRYTAHPTATIDPGCDIGEGTTIWHYSHLMEGARIGRDCTIGQNVFVASGAVIGDRVKLQNNVSVYDGVVLEDEVFCGPSMVFTNVRTPRSHLPRQDEFQRTLVKHGATVGANATVVCGHTIGRYAFVGAGAVVTDDVPDYALVVGVPAKVVGWMCQCGVRLPARNGEAHDEQACPRCETVYRWVGQRFEARA